MFLDGYIIGQPDANICLLERRFDAASIVLNNTTLWVVGGEVQYGHNLHLKSSEFIFIDQPPIEGPDLPFSISGHCMVQYDKSTIFIIGGVQDKTTSKNTWIVNPNDFQLRKGPALNIARSGHSCGTMILNGKKVIVAGKIFLCDLSRKIINSIKQII